MLEEMKTPRNALLGVFYAYFRGGLCLRLVLSSIFIQPFAYVVGYYTCQHRNYKCAHEFHFITSPLLEVDSNLIIAYSPKTSNINIVKNKKQYLNKRK